MPFVKVRDINVYYEIAGSGPRLFYLPGRAGDLRHKGNAFEMPMAQHFEMLAFDQRGTGRTDKPELPYTMADYADDAAALLDAVGWQSCNVIGVSFGGMVAQELALRHPDHVERLVLCCTSSGGAGGASYPVHELFRLPDDERRRIHIGITDKRRDLDWQAAHPEEARRAVDALRDRESVGADEPNHDLGAMRQMEARAAHDTYDRLPQMRMPVFLAGGVWDMQTPPDNLEALKRQITSARLEFFDGGHGFINQDPKAQERITAFLLGKLDD